MSEISVSGICERDIDLLLAEELSSSHNFLVWFAGRISAPAPNELISTRRSVTQSNGESDLEITFEDGGGAKCLILIENKVAASFQKDQAKRYRDRAENYVKSGAVANCCTVLVAPATYLARAGVIADFDAQVPYEELIKWFGQQSGRRAIYKNYLLRTAAEKSTKGYNPVEDGPVSEFWSRYWEMASEVAPELSLERPAGKPAGAGFIHFRPLELPNGIHIVHKLRYGVVDLQIAGGAKRLMEIKSRVGSLLESGMAITRATKSAAVRIGVSELDAGVSFDDQAESVMESLSAAKRLFRWARSHCDGLGSLAD